jgi:phosphatidylserine decarboxylase
LIRIDPAAWPFVGGTLALALVMGWAISWTIAIPFIALAAVFLFFFRDPNRNPPSGRDLVVSPADGRVLVAGPALPDSAPPGEWQQVSIFLSPMDVHVNRVPTSGRVMRVTYTPGRFLPAYRDNAGAINERSEVWIDHGGQTIVMRQIVGILARRVVCRVAVGAEVHTGERFGVMKFGSRMDVFVPLAASLTVKPGDVVVGGESPIAVLH